MAVTIHTEHDVQAAPAKVWEVITDFASYPDWNPLHRRIELRGEFAPGTDIRISLQMGKFKSRHGARLVTVDHATREFGWIAQAGLLPGLVVVRRSFRVEAAEGGAARFVQHEVDSGVAVPLLFAGGAFERRIRVGFEALVEALRRRVADESLTP